ncbi:MAG: hypothetical protein HLUCCX21_02670 [Porphyrobacter sp. HL-46]|nr:MAG: hypothetical protein HLUCCX21_02670 [Porphyrobacter sp. HL-46]
MDLNQLLYAHQVAKMGASRAGDAIRRDEFAADVTLFAARIRHLREDSGADVTGPAFVAGERGPAASHG